MRRAVAITLLTVAPLALAPVGCRAPQVVETTPAAPSALAAGSAAPYESVAARESTDESDASVEQVNYVPEATRIDDPAVDVPATSAAASAPPLTLATEPPSETWDMSLEEAVRTALGTSQVMRDLGALVVTAPATATTVYDAALQQTDPRFGPEAALSDFDAQLSGVAAANRNERTLNNAIGGGGTTGLRQNTGTFEGTVSKTTAVGTEFALRKLADYDKNNIPLAGPMDSFGNRFRSAWDVVLEAEVRQPLLQGAGVQFNRIAGPNSTPGNYNGVLIARVNTDIVLADFERGVRDFVRDVEQTYWQLYFAFRDLDAKLAARDAALQTWRVIKEKLDAGAADREEEALARERYYAAVEAVENALSGTVTSGLVVETSGGVYTVERRLRQLLGLPASDGRLIRPADVPSAAGVHFDWEESLGLALSRRVELRRQRWEIKRREMELIAARNFLRGRLDFLAIYRARGFGDTFWDDDGRPNDSALKDLWDGNLQEWQLGVQYSKPLGNRIGHTAVRNAQLQLARARAVYQEQELQISHELASAFAELDRARAVARTTYNRRLAAHERLDAVRVKYETREVLLEFLLEAVRQASEADSSFYRAVVNYTQAISSLHNRQGTLLDFMGIYLSEGPWSEQAHQSAARSARRFRTRKLNYVFRQSPAVSRGPYPQEILPQPLPPVEQVAPPAPQQAAPPAAPPAPVPLPML